MLTDSKLFNSWEAKFVVISYSMQQANYDQFSH